MTTNDSAMDRQRDLYLSEVLGLMAAREYMRLYRDVLARRVALFSAVRAIASSSAIAAWAIWQSHPMIWGGVIAASQVADALKDVFPFAARHKAANDLFINLEALSIEVLFEAEGVITGRFTEVQITERRRILMKSRHDADVKHFPAGNLPERRDLKGLANKTAASYYASIFMRDADR